MKSQHKQAQSAKDKAQDSKQMFALLQQQLAEKQQNNDCCIEQIANEQRAILQLQGQLALQNNKSLLEIDLRTSQLIKLDTPTPRTHPQHDAEPDLQDKERQIRGELLKEERVKLMRALRKKESMLNSLNSLKPDTNLYHSHQRVLLKELIQEYRAMNQQMQGQNQQLTQHAHGITSSLHNYHASRQQLQALLQPTPAP